jgi:hypothetical protein
MRELNLLQADSITLLLSPNLVRENVGNNFGRVAAWINSNHLDIGKVYGWGLNQFSQVGVGKNRTVPYPTLLQGALSGQNIVDVCVGWYHTIAVSNTSELFGWGANTAGAVGTRCRGFCTRKFDCAPSWTHVSFLFLQV